MIREHQKSGLRHGKKQAHLAWKTDSPNIIYGTAWKKDDTARLVSEAVINGFRAIDTACQPKHYNEPGVGEGWVTAAEQLGLNRSDFYLQTKFTDISGQDKDNVPYNTAQPTEEQVKESLEVSLRNLQTDYLDALVLHSPFPTIEKTIEIWRIMEAFVDSGKVHKLGISNIYSMEKLQQLYDSVRIKPSVVQNRFRIETKFDTSIRIFCKAHNISYQSFWTLTANRKALQSPGIAKLARGKGLTPQTLMFAFMMTLGHSPLSGTKNEDHMIEDVAIAQRIVDGEQILTEDELNEIGGHLGLPQIDLSSKW